LEKRSSDPHDHPNGKVLDRVTCQVVLFERFKMLLCKLFLPLTDGLALHLRIEFFLLTLI
jgi:hypothetical protein